ncbi:MAG: guanitoxin biosynthesis MATE family efflux transporter GntT [Scytonema sp. PMC 1069.18]|nr:guanitoxin biosynthesis MATE family efflux transporter GntT [Scytonema sp. PMC 1069.18]MEC4881313.1 guanitoxin biosynthesis MATE family efflux transporter GntT [Scytonema sp. PMC 1070.18]
MNITLPNQYDFLPRFSRLAFVNVLSNIMEPLAGTISIAFLGHLSKIDHLAGVTLCATLFSVIYSIISFLRMGITGVTAQAVGRDDHEEMLLVGLRNGLIALGIGGLFLLLQYPLQQLWFGIMSATPEVKASGIDYFYARIWGAPAVVLNLVIIGWFLGREMSGCVLLMSMVCNVANIAFDYLFIVHWDWASTGAGCSQTISQYLMLVVGITLASLKTDWKDAPHAVKKFWNANAFKAALTLNSNLFIRSSANVFVWTVFTALSSTMGTTVLAENALLLQILLISVYIFEGIGFAAETLSGKFKGQQANERLLPVLQVTVGSSLQLGLIIALVCILFPETVFGLLTNHNEVTSLIKNYLPWLFFVLELLSVSLILDGYFAGLALGVEIRNASLSGAMLGFLPLALVAWYYHDNYILWFAVSVSMVTKLIVLGVQVQKTLKDQPDVFTGESSV